MQINGIQSNLPVDFKSTLLFGGADAAEAESTDSKEIKKLSIGELAKQLAKLRSSLSNLQKSSSVESLSGVGGGPMSIASAKSRSAVGTNDLSSNIADISELSKMKSGTFSINDVDFHMDVNIDSLGDLIDDINNSSANVKASFDTTEQKLQIRSVGAWEQVDVDDGTSNFFTQLNVTEGAHGPAEVPEQQKFLEAEKFSEELVGFSKSLQDLFEAEFDYVAEEDGEEAVKVMKEAVKDVFKEVFSISEKEQLESYMGINFDFEDDAEEVMRVDTAKLASSVMSTPDNLADFVLGRDGGGGRTGGFLSGIEKALNEITETLVPKLGPGEESGLSLNVSA